MGTWRILVADDEPYVVLALHEVLATLPSVVLEAQDGEEALRIAREERPDLILLDVKMPGMDGFQVAEALKQDPVTADIPLVFLSALGGTREKVRGLELGAEDYLAKPVDGEELKARLRSVLRRTRGQAPAPSETAAPAPAPAETPVPAPAPAQTDLHRGPQAEARPAAQTRVQPRPPAAGRGRLETTGLAALLRSLEAERRTARVILRRGDEQGEIVLVDGRIWQTVQGPRQGEPAVYHLFTWQEGTFELAAPDAAGGVAEEISTPTKALVLEGSRRLLEIPDLRSRLAESRGPLRVPDAMHAAVRRQAAARTVALVALLDGTRGLDQVLADSPLDAWSTLRVLHRLLAVGALESEPVAPDRRSGLRLRVGVPIEYQSLGIWQESSTFNLSPWGVFIRTAVPYDVGAEVILRFRLPGQETGITATGRVVWANADPSLWGGMGMGIQFSDLPAADRETIEQYLAETIATQLSSATEHP